MCVIWCGSGCVEYNQSLTSQGVVSCQAFLEIHESHSSIQWKDKGVKDGVHSKVCSLNDSPVLCLCGACVCVYSVHDFVC